MSSDDSGFDKEAERERLRKKYEADEQDRANTRRMSELLLKGATMTGKHCDDCGDPIFRYDGQEFCPTCQHQAQQTQQGKQSGPSQQGQQTQQNQQPQQNQTPSETRDATDEATDADRSEGEAASAGEAVSGGEDPGAVAEGDADVPEQADAGTPGGADADRSPDSDAEPRVEIHDVRVADRHADRSAIRTPPSQRDEPAQRDDTSRRAREDSHHPHAHDSGDLASARDALVRKLTDLASRAEETDDVARARELLAATREAAEALEALDRANR